ncbi:helix-turn-helix transcriptional regulator [Nocardia sp. NBC_00508]|uniref:helix-turn-helix domain-containing protein n=1 Tax=Nocardia sp. NBC_00508 TaxID=2975992 RepID=UPI002E7FEC39|nr:helix-turn-helix domain-containing protein [Nocardia sp. NBC_00508]WUD69214.1 helix-turn-helix transcriptional regulator [Nocardia sp. NBC_00508]
MRNATGIGAYLRERRLAAGLTATHLAERAGLAEPVLDQVETGAVTPSYPLLEQLFDALEVPTWYRRHIVVLTLPNFFEAAYGPGPEVPTPDDRADLHSLPDPACYQRMPTQDLVAANSAFERTFPGAVARSTMLEWMFLDSAAKRVMVDWAVEAQLLVDAFRILSPLALRERVEEIAERCRRSPDWDRMWTTEVRSADIPRSRVQIRDLATRRVRTMSMRVYSPELPQRPWWLYRLVPIERTRGAYAPR